MKFRFLIITYLIFLTNILNAQNIRPLVTAFEVMEMIKQNVKPEWTDSRTDTIIIGSASDTITGIATCMFLDMNILRRALADRCNMIITHEPTFYDANDRILDFMKNDKVLKEKIDFINKNRLVVFRFHDNIHSDHPDQIMQGLANEIGGAVVNYYPYIVEVQKQRLDSFSKFLKAKFEFDGIRVMGDPDLEINRVGLVPGLAPTLEEHIGTLGRDDVDVILVGEAREWEDYIYAKDAICQKKPKAAIFIGHQKSEEPGMKYCAKWLQGFIMDVPIKFLENENYW